jgi:hypothetical protein
MRFRSLFLAAALTGVLALGADRPVFSGTWILDPAQSTGEIPSWSGLSIGHNSTWYRLPQFHKHGRVIRNVEGECRTDGRFHPVDGGNGGSISCKWDGTALVTEQHWGNDAQRRTVRTTLSPNGRLIQDIHREGPDGSKDSHVVWTRQQ